MPQPVPLARHYYEARREVLAACGTQSTPWYRLTPDERSVAVAEAAIIVEALRRVDEEHAVLVEAITNRQEVLGDRPGIAEQNVTRSALPAY